MSGDALQVLVNGQALDCVSTSDRGLLYGDGVFETVAVSGGKPCFWERHIKRLQSGCERLGMEAVNVAQLAEECQLLIGESQRAVIKIIITRGSGGRGYRFPEHPHATRIIQLHAWPDWPVHCAEHGILTRICHTRLGHNPSLAGIKHLNRLEQVLARREWDEPDIMEGLMLDADGRPVEGTMSNLFMVQDARLMTPDLTHCGVAGIMRGWVLDKAKQHAMEIRVQQIELKTLLQADEVFVCNSLIGIWPVTGIDGYAIRKGAVTSQLQTLLDREMTAKQAGIHV